MESCINRLHPPPGCALMVNVPEHKCRPNESEGEEKGDAGHIHSSHAYTDTYSLTNAQRQTVTRTIADAQPTGDKRILHQ